jgi:hypothetical protein
MLEAETMVNAAQISVEEAKAEANRLKALLAHIRKEVKAERVGSPPASAELHTVIDRTNAEIEAYQRQINAAKALAKKRKREIDEWKQWYQGTGSIDKTVEKARLDVEIDWRGAEINIVEAKIGELETRKWQSRERLELAEQRLAALEAGVYDRPLAEDPRLLDLQAAYQAATARLKAVQAAQKNKNNKTPSAGRAKRGGK